MTDALPLFLLSTSALPGEEVPLHVFEPRYRALVAYCESTGSEFGVLLEDDEGVREIGCAVAIEEIVERHDDGRIDLIARGTRRFTLAGEVTEGAYPSADVTWLHDEPIDPHEDDDEDAEEAMRLFNQLAVRVTGDAPELGDDGLASFRIASRVAFGGPAKQGLLELRSEARRLALLERLLRAALARLEQVELQEAAARSNGKVHFD
ncbi:MAG: LON peptidase substrate-binding domain-containing protein [Solirubrobacteraceae bacterium]|nr:LON peptidase substrate-binding domain-containing protein [Solirubrobacteraceae bacterium]